MKTKKDNTSLFNFFVIGITLLLTGIGIYNSSQPNLIEGYINYKVEMNFGNDIDKYAARVNLPPEYFKALAQLECSGNTNNPHRFEPYVYKQFQKVLAGEIQSYENITRDMIYGASDKAIRELATSWGPFQLMGYKCIQLGVYVHDLRGKHAVYWGIRWINHDYGKLLRNKNFKDAFHYHNTGEKHPANGKSKTYDPNYVTNGLKYLKYF